MTRVEIFEAMCEGYLNERYNIWKHMGERDADWMVYKGGLEMLQAFGCDWQRDEDGEHNVHFLNSEDAKKLNIHAYD